MKKFSKHIEEMSMSVTLKPKKNNMYKVTSVGKKMAAHGGIKKGEKFHDSEIDGMNDSGIKVKYEKPKPSIKKESNSSMDRMMDTYNDHEDNKHPKVQSHIKKAKKAYDNGDHEGFHNHTQNAADAAYANRKQKNEAIERRMDRKTIIATDPATGRKVVKVAPKKEIDIGKGKNESVEEGKYNPNIKLPGVGGPEYMKNLKKSIADLKKKKEPKKEVNEISDTTKLSYINKANKAITDREKLHLKIGAKVDKDKTLEKMRKGVAVAKSKLGESEAYYAMKRAEKHAAKDGHDFHKLPEYDRGKDKPHKEKYREMAKNNIGEDMTPMQMYELKISTMQKYKQAARSDVQDGENARHKGYPEKAIDKRQDKRYKGIDTANKRIDKKQVKMAKGVAFDKRYKGGNMTGASNAINKIKPGLADHPKVKDALRKANEEFKGE